MKIIQKAIIKKGDTYLILKRSPNAEAFPNHWDFPGGKLEKGEDQFGGIEREILEETGLQSKAVAILGKYEIDVFGTGNPTHSFTVFDTKTVIADPVLSSEHTEYRWFTKEEIMHLPVEPYIKLFFSEYD